MTLPGFDDRPVWVEVAGVTDRGRQRSVNQDSFLVADLSRGAADGGLRMRPGEGPPDGSGRFRLGPRGSLFLVADGMGGASAGEVASEMATTGIYGTVRDRWGPERNRSPFVFARCLREAVEEANARIHRVAMTRPELRGMGTTVTVAGVLDGYLYLAQVGDSRAYLVRGGEARQLTRDQSVVQELLDAGHVTEEEARTLGNRHVILQALGVQPTVDVDLTYQQLRRGDVFVLCSDGLHGLMEEREIAQRAAGSMGVAAASRELVELANARGGPDNVTVVLARVEGEGLQEPREDDAVGRAVFETATP